MHFFAKKDFTAATVSVANYCNLFESEAGKQPEGLRSSGSSKNWSVAKLFYGNAHVFSYTFFSLL